MDSNTPKLNRKQEELVRRLEEIRRSQKQQEATVEKEAGEKSMEGRSLESRERPQSQGRNRNKPKRTSMQPKSRPSRNEQKRRQPSQQEKPSEAESWEMPYSEENLGSALPQDRPAARSSQFLAERKSTGGNLVDQLSDGNQLAKAIILNEVLSKPVALRKRYR